MATRAQFRGFVGRARSAVQASARARRGCPMRAALTAPILARRSIRSAVVTERVGVAVEQVAHRVEPVSVVATWVADVVDGEQGLVGEGDLEAIGRTVRMGPFDEIGVLGEAKLRVVAAEDREHARGRRRSIPGGGIRSRSESPGRRRPARNGRSRRQVRAGERSRPASRRAARRWRRGTRGSRPSPRVPRCCAPLTAPWFDVVTIWCRSERAHGVGQHRRRVVSRAVVDDDHFELLVLAHQRRQRAEGSSHASGVVVDGDDDGDRRRRGASDVRLAARTASESARPCVPSAPDRRRPRRGR